MNREKVMLGVLALLAVYAVLHYTVLNAPPEEPPPPENPLLNPLTKILAVRSAIPKIPEEPLEQKYGWESDLFSRTVTIEVSQLPETQQYELTGIEFSESSSAIINGEPVRIGSFFNGYQVVDITRDQVILYGNRERLVLSLENGTERGEEAQREFDEAFRQARRSGLETFEYRGRVYSTRLSSEEERE